MISISHTLGAFFVDLFLPIFLSIELHVFNNSKGNKFVLIIRTILNKCKRLLKIRNEIDNNTSIDQVISSFKPPIFWKEKDIVKKQAQSWSTNEVKEIIFKINDLEALVKKNSSSSLLFVSNFVSNY